VTVPFRMSYFVLLASISPSVKTKPKLLMEERRSISERNRSRTYGLQSVWMVRRKCEQYLRI